LDTFSERDLVDVSHTNNNNTGVGQQWGIEKTCFVFASLVQKTPEINVGQDIPNADIP
jgi:hypothetical protein